LKDVDYRVHKNVTEGSVTISLRIFVGEGITTSLFKSLNTKRETTPYGSGNPDTGLGQGETD
jgi:hypothetical protein